MRTELRELLETLENKLTDYEQRLDLVYAHPMAPYEKYVASVADLIGRTEELQDEIDRVQQLLEDK